MTDTIKLPVGIESFSEIRETGFYYEDYRNRDAWAEKMLVNISKAGFFSSDRTIEEYNKDIRKLC